MAERVFLASPIESGAGRVLVSPFQFLMTGDDHLRVEAWNIVASASLVMAYRFAGLDGKIIAERQIMPLTADRLKNEQDFTLREGYLVNMSVFTDGGVAQDGETFCCVKLIRGRGAAAIVIGVLLQGIVGGEVGLGWPGSPLTTAIASEPSVHSYFGTIPGVGSDIAETCPTGARWELVAMNAALQTSAIVTDRVPRFFLFSNGKLVVVAPPALAQAASLDRLYHWAPLVPFSGLLGSSVSQQPYPERIVLRAGDVFSTNTINMQANDAWAAPTYTVREWFEAA